MKLPKLIEFTKEELENQFEEGKIDVNFLIEYIVTRDRVYNQLIDEIEERDDIIDTIRRYDLFESNVDFDYEEEMVESYTYFNIDKVIEDIRHLRKIEKEKK